MSWGDYSELGTGFRGETENDTLRGPFVLLTGTYINPDWLVSLDWDKITDTPTTLAGYGITDGAVAVGAVLYTTQSLTSAQQAQAQSNLGVAPLFLAVNHTLSTTPQLAFSTSQDGITFVRVGAVNPYRLPAGEGARDPSMIYHASSGKCVITYTHVTAGGDGYDDKLGLAWTKDGETVTHITDITISGTGVTNAIVWNGAILEDSGRIIFTLLPMAADTNRQTPGAGWIEVQNPTADPTAWTFSSFTAFRATNSTFNVSFALNDVTILKVGATYHLFVDGYTAGGPGGPGSGSGGILHATSASWLTGYSALGYTGIASAEGAIGPVALPHGGYRLYSQVTFAELQYSDSAALTDGSWSAPVEVNFLEQSGIGNGDVIRLNVQAAQRFSTGARQLFGPRVDESGYTGWTLPLQSDHAIFSLSHARTGNGGTGRIVLSLFNDGAGITQHGASVLGQLNVSGNAAVTLDLTAANMTSVGRVDAGTYINSTAATNQIHYYFVTGSASHPALKPVNTALHVRLGNDSDFAPVSMAALTATTGTFSGAVSAPTFSATSITTGEIIVSSAIEADTITADSYNGVAMSSVLTQTNTVTGITNKTFVAPVLGAATATSLALGGATVGSHALAVTGTTTQAGTHTINLSGSGSHIIAQVSGATRVRLASFGGTDAYVSLDSDTMIIQGGASTDTYQSRASAGVWRDGTSSSNALGSRLLLNLIATGSIKLGVFTVATLPAAGTAGRTAYVTDSNAASYTAGIGAVAAAGGATIVPVFDNGTNWLIG